MFEILVGLGGVVNINYSLSVLKGKNKRITFLMGGHQTRDLSTKYHTFSPLLQAGFVHRSLFESNNGRVGFEAAMKRHDPGAKVNLSTHRIFL